MKISLIFFWILFLFSSCQVKEQAEQLKALEACTYEIESVDSAYLANVDLNQLITNGGVNLLKAPRIAFAYLTQKMPLKGVVYLKIINPGQDDAGINKFEYKVFVKDIELFNGLIDQKINIKANGGSTVIPVRQERDIYQLISNPGNQQAVTDFISAETEKTIPITFKIKPYLIIGNKEIAYPDYITIERRLSNTTLLSYLKSAY